MIYTALGILGFLLIHLFDYVSLKKIPFLKPVVCERYEAGEVFLYDGELADLETIFGMRA